MWISSRVIGSLIRLSKFGFAFSIAAIAIAATNHIPVVANSAMPIAVESVDRHKTKQDRLVRRPAVSTWSEFTADVASGKMRFINTIYDLPSRYSDGYVYRVQGANWVGAYVIRSGLRSYPQPTSDRLNELRPDIADQFLQSGNAIYFFWNRSSSAIGTDPNNIRFTSSRSACLGGNLRESSRVEQSRDSADFAIGTRCI
jgi:hypothetical protein